MGDATDRLRTGRDTLIGVVRRRGGRPATVPPPGPPHATLVPGVCPVGAGLAMSGVGDNQVAKAGDPWWTWIRATSK